MSYVGYIAFFSCGLTQSALFAKSTLPTICWRFKPSTSVTGFSDLRDWKRAASSSVLSLMILSPLTAIIPSGRISSFADASDGHCCWSCHENRVATSNQFAWFRPNIFVDHRFIGILTGRREMFPFEGSINDASCWSETKIILIIIITNIRGTIIYRR